MRSLNRVMASDITQPGDWWRLCTLVNIIFYLTEWMLPWIKGLFILVITFRKKDAFRCIYAHYEALLFLFGMIQQIWIWMILLWLNYSNNPNIRGNTATKSWIQHQRPSPNIFVATLTWIIQCKSEGKNIEWIFFLWKAAIIQELCEQEFLCWIDFFIFFNSSG